MEQLNIDGMEPVSTEPTVSPRKGKQQTRGDYYGIKPNALARNARAKLAKMRVKLEKLHEPWLEADPMLEQVTARVQEAIEALAQQFTDSAEYMNETME